MAGDTAAKPGERPHTPCCPRCGYDVSGDCSRWQTQCPLEGTCPECGLTFEWRYLLNPALAAPAWLFDTNPSRFWGPLIRTLIRSLWPPGIVRALRMEQKFSLKRSLVLVGVSALMVHLTAMVCGTVLAVHLEHRWLAHGAYRNVFESFGAVTRDDLRLPDGALVRHALWPYSHAEGYYNLPVTASLILTSIWATAVPLCFLPLSTSLHFARVRPVHIVRAAAFAAVPVSALTIITMIALTIGRNRWLFGPRFWEWERGPFTLTWIALCAVFMVLWWRWAVARYMRMDHAFAVTAAVLMMSFLAAALLVYITTPDLVLEAAEVVRAVRHAFR